MIFHKTMVWYLAIILSGMMAIVFYSFINAPLSPSTMFYYAKNIPIEQAGKFQQLIVEPENTTKNELEALKKKGIKVYAYLSIGEVGKYRSWANKLDKSWVLGKNNHWETLVMDMGQLGWHDFLLRNQIEGLWQAGYRGFFIDTMDSYQIYRNSPDQVLVQQQGIVRLIKAIDEKYSGVNLLFNRGFDILDEVADLIDGVVAESLFVGWNPKTSEYTSISAEDHYWLLDKLNYIREEYDLPVTVIDYLPVEQVVQGDRAKEIAGKIASLGFVPWVSTVELDQVGVGLENLIKTHGN